MAFFVVSTAYLLLKQQQNPSSLSSSSSSSRLGVSDTSFNPPPLEPLPKEDRPQEPIKTEEETPADDDDNDNDGENNNNRNNNSNQQSQQQQRIPSGKNKPRPILTAYLEDASDFDTSTKPIPPRSTEEEKLGSVEFPRVQQCSRLFETWPVDDFPLEDPYLPWIHDVFPTADGRYVQFVAQNRRRCETGKDLEDRMEYWEPQMALFQPIPIVQEEDGRLRIASSMDEATVQETRFICQFHTTYDDQVYQTFSEFKFNYEYVSWRKGKSAMFEKVGKDNVQFWLSQLLFKCPIPDDLQGLIIAEDHIVDDLSQIFVDIVPIRTPARQNQHVFTKEHVGDTYMRAAPLYDLMGEFGKQHYLPALADSGRWANIPICAPPQPKQHNLVACTWTAKTYTRRGDVVQLGDTEARLREWIAFHKMVGFDHLYVYDNSSPQQPKDNSTVTTEEDAPLKAITDEFDFVDYHRWPCQICNNNRPSHKNPGERSSQYAAEASCRERYGPFTNWMAFIDTDEYLIPMQDDTWQPLLNQFDDKGIHILKMRSSRAKPRQELME